MESLLPNKLHSHWLTWLLALAVLAGVPGCQTTGPSPPSPIPEGYYLLDAPMFYKNGLAKVTWDPPRLHIELLEHHRGQFDLRVGPDGNVRIERDAVHLGDIHRNLSGSGQIGQGSQVRGTGEIWTRSLSIISRDHRTGEWVLSPAPAGERDKRLKRIEAVEKARAERDRR